ncbi:MAG: hypothetical protein ACM34I_11040 [bacterium]
MNHFDRQTLSRSGLAILRRSARIAGVSVTAVMFVLSLSFGETAENWRSEFDAICEKVMESDDLTVEELQELISKADKLLPQIEASDDPSKKVFIFRLKKCRDLFEYMVQMKKQGF